MKIEFRKVTWYSLTLTVILFVVVLIGAVYFAFQLGKISIARSLIWVIQNNNLEQQNQINIKGWFTFTSDKYGFNFKYPKELDNLPYNVESSGQWRYNASLDEKGTQVIRLLVSAIFEMGTNFTNAEFNVGVSSDPLAISNCLKPDYMVEASSMVDINGVQFHKFSGTDVGAGNYYQVESYRTLHNDSCYGIDLVIHSVNIYNYPKEFGVKPFDYSKIHNLLLLMLQSFKFSN